MTIALIVVGVVVVLWIAAHMKTDRCDGVLVEKMHAYRRMMQFIMPTRNESVVYFDTFVDAEELLEYIERARQRFDCGVTHCLVGAVAAAARENPQMNQFIVGRRIYQRKRWEATFVMKRKKLDKTAKLAPVKLAFDDDETFEQLCARINDSISYQRTDAKTSDDKELDLLGSMPRPLLRVGVGLLRTLDYFNILPKSFIEHDKMYTSIVITNLGSVGMDAGYHHLYEWGTCPLFMMVGRISERAVIRDGKVVARKMLHIRWSYDERIDDGLTSRFGIDAVKGTLEKPFGTLGCVEEDGSDQRRFGDIITNPKREPGADEHLPVDGAGTAQMPPGNVVTGAAVPIDAGAVVELAEALERERARVDNLEAELGALRSKLTERKSA